MCIRDRSTWAGRLQHANKLLPDVINSPFRQYADQSSKPSRKTTPERWKVLYYVDKEFMDQKRKMLDKLKNLIEMDPECTFTPEINPRTRRIHNGEQHEQYSVVERSYMWKESIDKRLDRCRKDEEESKLAACTFQPFLIASRASSSGKPPHTKKSVFDHNGSKSYLDRQKKAREMHKNADQHQQQLTKRHNATSRSRIGQNLNYSPPTNSFMENDHPSASRSFHQRDREHSLNRSYEQIRGQLHSMLHEIDL
eukprot:TRINITY_DN10743_c0_g1_i2.p1 TRINITY_DN10743_c0_g1~~TRINITY_DN10743_c0_g1_i2.p1  ORF type:complete len:253 (+),score=40.85 TRINITY_DN10743_c0_g1_i2:66-824(+)